MQRLTITRVVMVVRMIMTMIVTNNMMMVVRVRVMPVMMMMTHGVSQ